MGACGCEDKLRSDKTQLTVDLFVCSVAKSSSRANHLLLSVAMCESEKWRKKEESIKLFNSV